MDQQQQLESYRQLMAEVYELAGVSRRISEREATAEGSTVARWHVLSVVSGERLSVSAIARRLGLVRQGVQRVADELVSEGYLDREPNPAHARSPLVMATPSGLDLLDRLWTASERSRRQALASAGLDEDDLVNAKRILSRLSGALHELDRDASRRPHD